MQTIVLNVQGMTCSGCVNSIRKVLEPIPGVRSVEVSLDKGVARIEYDETKAGIEQFKSAIEEAGYDVR